MKKASTYGLISHRNLERLGPPAYTAAIEAEDVLLDSSDFETIPLAHHSQQLPVRVRRALGWGARGIGGQKLRLPASLALPGRSGSVEHAIFMARSPAELPLIERMRELRNRSTVISIWFIELWPSTVERWVTKHDGFGCADNIFVANRDTVEALRSIVPNTNVSYLPPAVDAVRFKPNDVESARPVSVLGIGRRDAQQHTDLLAMARQENILYHYDTIVGEAKNWLEHRNALANLYQLSAVSICNYAKHDQPEVIGDQRLIPARLFEGMAAGSILAGDPPDEDEQKRLFGQTVVNALLPGADLNDQLRPFLDPEHTKQERERNMSLAFKGHDWAHRWETLLGAVDLPVPDRLAKRLSTLAEWSAELDNESGGLDKSVELDEETDLAEHSELGDK